MTPAGFLALLVAAGPAEPTDELIRSVESASQAALESPTDVRGEGELRMALDAVRKSPLQTAQSRRLRRSRIDGLLSLAAVYLARGDTEKAWDAVDEALRASGDTLGDSEGTIAVQDLISRWKKTCPWVEQSFAAGTAAQCYCTAEWPAAGNASFSTGSRWVSIRWLC